MDTAHLLKIIVGLVVGLAIGAGCRWFDIPVPSPPSLIGALLVVAMTSGYMLADMLITRHAAAPGLRQASTRHLCGGPTGQPHSRQQEAGALGADVPEQA